jgi:hypothetical protein
MYGEVQNFCPFRSTANQTVPCSISCALAIHNGIAKVCSILHLASKMGDIQAVADAIASRAGDTPQ